MFQSVLRINKLTQIILYSKNSESKSELDPISGSAPCCVIWGEGIFFSMSPSYFIYHRKVSNVSFLLYPLVLFLGSKCKC